MPGMNGTGPMGAGPQTGRALGYCGKADIDSIFRANPWGDQGIDSPALKMAFMKKLIFNHGFYGQPKL